MDALHPNKNEFYKFLECEQADKIDLKRVMERVKKEIRKRLDSLTGLNLNDKNLMKAINCQVKPVAGYLINVCNLGKGDLDELDMAVKSVLRREGFNGRQLSHERLYSKRNKGGRGFKSFKEAYDETKTRVACYMAAVTNKWIGEAWRNGSQKEQISLKKKAMRKVGVTVSIGEGSVIIGKESYIEWKEGWKKLKKLLTEGQKKE